MLRVVITGNVSVATHVARNRCWEIQRDTTCEPQLRNSKMPSRRGTRVPTIRKIAVRSIRRILSHGNSHIHVVYLRYEFDATRNDSRDRNLWKNGGRVISSNDGKDCPRKVAARFRTIGTILVAEFAPVSLVFQRRSVVYLRSGRNSG